MLKSSWHYVIVNWSNPPSCTSLLHLFISWKHYPICLSKPQSRGSWENMVPLKTNSSEWIQLKWLNFMFFHVNAKIMCSINVKVLLLTACSLPVFQTITYKVMTFHGDMRICLLSFCHIYTPSNTASFLPTVHSSFMFVLHCAPHINIIQVFFFFFFLSGTHRWDLLTLNMFAKTYIL